MAGLCEGGNEPPGSLKASKSQLPNFALQAMSWELEVHSHTSLPRRMDSPIRANLCRARPQSRGTNMRELLSEALQWGFCVCWRLLTLRAYCSNSFPPARLLGESIKSDPETDQEEEKELVGSLTEKKLKDALEGMMNGRKVEGRRGYQMIDDIKIYGSYEETKRKAENRTDWRSLVCSEKAALGQNTK
ncbi:hypothetical protein ANN_03431 [Periplaneta americana]|uniref:Uncharacterized protein n=1 Tax=Periplaneta americana TaxID=6978 RepID=A0ABQ8TZ07_PERAM|nr:hypothetical protein ANN_03431 [Periplaneta americana]